MSIVGCGSSGGGSSSSTGEEILEGVAIDGYIDEALVTMNGYATLTYSDGTWGLPKEAYKKGAQNIVEVVGGIDISTGEKYEGFLKAVVTDDGSIRVVNLFSSLVVAMVQNGVPQALAEEKIAKQLGVTVESLNSDPITILRTGTPQQKREAGILLQQSLAIQKIAEIFSKSIVSENSVFSAVINSMSQRLYDGKSFGSVVSDIETLAKDLQSRLTKMDINELTTIDPNMGTKLLSASRAAQTIGTMITRFDPSTFENSDNIYATLRSKAKAIEIISNQLESEIEKLESMTPTALLGFDYQNTIKGLMMLGGVDGIEALMIRAQQSIGMGENQELDASAFSKSFFGGDSTVLQEQALVYDEIKVLCGASGAKVDESDMADMLLGANTRVKQGHVDAVQEQADSKGYNTDLSRVEPKVDAADSKTEEQAKESAQEAVQEEAYPEPVEGECTERSTPREETPPSVQYAPAFRAATLPADVEAELDESDKELNDFNRENPEKANDKEILYEQLKTKKGPTEEPNNEESKRLAAELRC